MRILIIEDEVKVTRALAEGLKAEQYDVIVSHKGEDGFALLCAYEFDMLLLDLMLPGLDGLAILRELRKRGMGLPVLILTAKDAVEDRVRGLEAGADDYLVKPFAFSELCARIKALARRGKPEPAPRLRCADLDLDCVSRSVNRGGVEVSLTTKEYELLEYLVRRQGSVVSRDMLARDVWKVERRAAPMDNVIDVHVARLRRKIDEPFDRRLLKTIRGVGFVLEG
jgi:two-component system, OmpR family, copper resistance phosphate regulon response regulator CusR